MKTKIFAITLSATLLFSSCLGEFMAFNNLKDWNKGVTENKYLNNLIFWGLTIIPVYGLFGLGDMLIFNVVEFWSGTNPLAMKEGQKEIEIVEKNNKKYELVATKNKLTITVVEGENAGESIDLTFRSDENAWFLNKEGKEIKLADYKEGVNYVYLPDGKAIEIEENATLEYGLAKIEMAKLNYNLSKQVAMAK